MVGVKKEQLDNSINVTLKGGPFRGMVIRVYPDDRKDETSLSPVTIGGATYSAPLIGMDWGKPTYIIQ